MRHLTGRQRRQQKTKQAILRAARELVSENGANGLSLRAIARRIDYSPAGLYEYFDSKHELVEAVCDEGIQRLRTYLEQVPRHLPPEARLHQLGLAYLEFARQEPELFRLIFTTTTSERRSLDDPTPSDSPYRLLLEATQAAIEAGALNLEEGVTLEQVAFGLWAVVHGMAMLEQTQFRHLETDLNPTQRWVLATFGKGLRAA